MNRRTALLLSPVALLSLVGRAEASPAPVQPNRYCQWTGYHWVEIVDGVITHVHTGDEWVMLIDESLDVNRVEYGSGRA
jgi:hypothetical protein